MKVLHATVNLDAASGVVTFVTRLNQELLENGIESVILVESDPFPSEIAADIIHIHGLWRPFFHRLSKLAHAQRIPVVWSTHGMTAPWSLRHKWLKKWVAWHLYQKRDLRQAQVVHSTSSLEFEWNKRQGCGVQCIVPLGADLPVKVCSATKDNTHILLYVGRIYPVKALDNLIMGFQLAQHAGWKLRIVGPDEDGYLEVLREIAGPDVEFVGPKYGSELSAEYARCDCLALVSHTENFGATVVDAMANAKPVITSTNTPWSDVVEYCCGWWVDNTPASLMGVIGRMMALNDVVRADMGRRGRQLVEEKFTWSAVASSMMDVYKKYANES